MKVAVTDACIFIDLLDSEACSAFFQLQYEIVTTRQVWMELESDQREVLETWIETNQLKIISGVTNVKAMRDKNNLSKGLSIADLTVWSLTDQVDGILLTSDGLLRKMAKKHKIETHGLLWVFNQLVEQRILPVKEATEKLQVVFNQNTHYKSDSKLYEAFEALLTKWQDLK